MLPEKLIQNVLIDLFNIRSDETFLMVVDDNFKDHGQKIVDAAEKHCKRAEMVNIPIGKRNGQEPPNEAAKAMLEHDVQMYWTTKSLSHTDARRAATKMGHRIISSPGMTVDMFERCVDIDYGELLEVHKELQPLIAQSKMIRVVSSKGTDISFSVHDTHGRPGKVIKHQKGAFGNLPGDEVDSGVVRETMNGTLVFDGSFPEVGVLDEEVVVEVKSGIGTIVSENESSRKIKGMLDEVGKDAFKIAEFGIGTNPKAKLTGVVLEDEKIRGTVHFAFGNDITYGGDNDVGIHIDGIITNPTVIVDGVKTHENGRLLLESCKY